MRDKLHTENLFGELSRIIHSVFRELDTSAFSSAPGMNLSLDHEYLAVGFLNETACRGFRLIDRKRGVTFGDWHSVTSEDLFGLIFVYLHGEFPCREPGTYHVTRVFGNQGYEKTTYPSRKRSNGTRLLRSSPQRSPRGRRQDRQSTQHQVIEPRQKVIRTQFETPHIVVGYPCSTQRMAVFDAFQGSTDGLSDHKYAQLPWILPNGWIVFEAHDSQRLHVNTGFFEGHPTREPQRILPRRPTTRGNVVPSPAIRPGFLHDKYTPLPIETKRQRDQ